MRETFTQALFRMLSEILGTPEGLLFVAFAIFMLAMVGVFPRLKWLSLSLALWISSFGVFKFHEIHMLHNLPFPLGQIRGLKEILVPALLILPIIGLAFSSRLRSQKSLFFAGSAIYLSFHAYMAFRHGIAGNTQRAGWGMVVWLIVFLAIPVVAARWVSMEGHVRNLLLAVVLFGILFTLSNVYALVAAPNNVIWGRRLFGTTGNQNHLAQMIGLMFPPTILLASSISVNKLFKLFLYGIAATQLILLFASGSRTGLVIVTLAVLIFFRARLGRFFITGVGVLIAFAIGMQFAGDSLEVGRVFGRLSIDQETRSGAWIAQWNDFMAHPLTGIVGTEAPLGYSENSYLATAARFGIVGLALLLAAIGSFIWGALHTVILTRRLGMSPEWQKLADLALAGVVSLAAGGVFEGYLMGNLAPGYMMFYVYGIMIVFIRQAAYAAGPTMDRLPEMGRLPAVALS